MNTDILMTVKKVCLNKDDQFKLNFWTNMYKFAEQELIKLQEKHSAEFLQRENDVISKEDISQVPSEEPAQLETKDPIEEIR